MKIIDKYIGTTVIKTILMVVLVLVAMQIFIQFSNELTDMGTGNYGIVHVMLYVLMLLPYNVYQFFPMAGLIGSLLGLGLLASRSELIVMRAAGVSLLGIGWSVIKAAMLVMLFALLLGEVIAPVLQHTATLYKAAAISKGQALHTRHGTWVRSGADFVHIDAVLPKGKLRNITRYKFDKHYRLTTATFAKEADYINGKWLFHDIAMTIFGKNSISTKNYQQQHWNFDFKPRLLGLVNIDTDEKSLPQLHTYITYLHRTGLQSNRYEVAFWQRIMQPFATLVMILLAVPFIFGPLRTVTMGLRILAGTVTGLIFYIVNQFIGPISSMYQLPPIAIACVPTMLVAAFGIMLLLRAK